MKKNLVAAIHCLESDCLLTEHERDEATAILDTIQRIEIDELRGHLDNAMIYLAMSDLWPLAALLVDNDGGAK